MPIKKTHSLNTISKEMNISKAAVSLILNGKARQNAISEELEKRVLAYCQKINYRPNIHAQRMNQKQVKNIGILINENITSDEDTPLGEYNVSHMIGGIAKEADAAGYRFSLQLYHSDMRDDSIFEWFRTKEIGGLIYYGIDMPDKWRTTFRTEDYKVVGVSINPEQNLPCINVDNYSASFRLTKYLIDKGHKKFLYISGGGPNCFPTTERYRGFRDALNESDIGFSDENYFNANFSREATEKFIKDRWTSGKLDEDAIVCANDVMAIGSVRALTSAGIRVPEDIAVTGADNISTGQLITPALTTFDFLPLEQGKAAFHLLLDIINGEKVTENVVLNPLLHFRKSG